VHRIAINVAISSQRRERLREVGQLIRRLGTPVQPDPTDALMNSELLRELQALPTKQTAAVILRYFHGYSNREIAYALGLPERTVASRLIRARAQLRGRLADLYEWRTSPARSVPSDE
jgi:RNA polymerase sigma factor (sigma-70 family)